MKKTFYVTTPIYYVNDRPHIGHTYTTVLADIVARYERLRGRDVMFSVGVDENSQKNVQAMEKAGESDLKTYLDRMAGIWKETWRDLGISFDDFIRTTEERHLRGVNRFWDAVVKSGDIYEGVYEGKYCVGCEAFKVESDLENDHCPLHLNKELELVREKNYFFRASAYRDVLLKHIETRPEFVQPETRRHEVMNYIKDHFADFSVSREAKNLQVGIPVPGDDSQRIYVWFDALLNYLTVIGYGTDDEAFRQRWPISVHLEGKDIVKFHCALFPAMLMSAAKNDAILRDEQGKALLPERIFSHGFFTIDGQKISKSLGNAVDPRELVPRYGFDVLRYFLLREISFGEDGDFSTQRLEERYVHDLANTLGNLLNRSVAMSRKYFNNAVPGPRDFQDSGMIFCNEHGIASLRKAFEHACESIRFDEALAIVWNGVDGNYGLLQANKFIEDTKPFKLVKTYPEATAAVLYSMLEYCRLVAWLIEPIMPQVAASMIRQLGQYPDEEKKKGIEALLAWGGLKSGATLPEPKILFPPLESKA